MSEASLPLLLAALASAQEGATWKKDLGKPAPPLVGSAWVGTPVSLEAVRGNTVILVFWNGDIPC